MRPFCKVSDLSIGVHIRAEQFEIRCYKPRDADLLQAEGLISYTHQSICPLHGCLVPVTVPPETELARHCPSIDEIVNRQAAGAAVPS